MFLSNLFEQIRHIIAKNFIVELIYKTIINQFLPRKLKLFRRLNAVKMERLKRSRYEQIEFCFDPKKEEERYYSEIDKGHRGLLAEIEAFLNYKIPTRPMRPYKRKTVSNRRLSDRMRERNEIVKKVMYEHKLRLGQASKYVKEHGLWK